MIIDAFRHNFRNHHLPGRVLRVLLRVWVVCGRGGDDISKVSNESQRSRTGEQEKWNTKGKREFAVGRKVQKWMRSRSEEKICWGGGEITKRKDQKTKIIPKVKNKNKKIQIN